MKRFSLLPLVMCLWAILLSACETAPQRSFLDADLFLALTDMPSGWAIAESISKVTDNEGQVSGAAISFYALDTKYDARFTQIIYRYSGNGTAARHYDRFENDMFSDTSVYRTTPWAIPANFTFSPKAAEHWHFGCAGSNFTIGPSTGTRSTICRYLAQHDEFLVILYIDMKIDEEAFISVLEINKVIETMDQRVYSYLVTTPTVLP